MYLDGIGTCKKGVESMVRQGRQRIWVAVRVERGFIVEVKAFATKKSAQGQEQRWRSAMNPDYDETGICDVVAPRRHTC